MEPFRLHTTLTLADWHAMQRVCAAYERSSRLAEPREGSVFFSPCEYEIRADGIVSMQRGGHAFTPWQLVTEVTATTEHIFIWLETFSGHVIPVRDLPEGMSAEQVVAGCKEWMAAPAAQEPQLPSLATQVAVEGTPSTLRTVFRLLTLRGVEHPGGAASALSGKPLPIAVLALVSLALWGGLSWFYYLPEPQFFPYSAPALAWYVLAALAVAAAMAKGSHPRVAFSQVCSLLAILMPVLIVADFAIVRWIPERWADVARGVLALYAIGYCARGLHSLTLSRQRLGVLFGFAVAATFIWVANALYVYPAVWTSRDTEEYAEDLETQDGGAEALLFEQAARIDASVAQIERASGDVPAGFFVGFAGYGEQRVFAEEIKFAAHKFAERFDTSERTLLLINDRRDRQAEPLATVSGLRYALEAVASKMRLDQDVLFLSLSSHGSEDPLLSVENGMLPLRDLTGDALAEALRASGIKWRVIVISACHAGAFIKSLQDPYTVVITAAAPDRTSFGCSDDRDLTYFGEAFFRDSLPKAASLREAFDSAKELVSERESKEGFDASNPQAFFGESIEPRLTSMLRAASAP